MAFAKSATFEITRWHTLVDMTHFYWERTLFAILVSTGISVRGLRKKSLSIDGAVTAFVTGLIHCFAGYDVTFVLAFFFFSSSYFTKYKQEVKHKLEADFKEGTPQRANHLARLETLASERNPIG